MERKICPGCKKRKVFIEDTPLCLDCRESVLRKFTEKRSLEEDPGLSRKRRRALWDAPWQFDDDEMR